MDTIGLNNPTFSDEWELHKHDKVWRKFWALWEFRRKWNWANDSYIKLDRVEEEIVAPEYWSQLHGGYGFMHLSLWIALLNSIYEGITEGLDDYATSKHKKVPINKIIDNIPKDLIELPTNLKKSFKNYRNAVFHCQWVADSKKLFLDQDETNELSKFHNNVGDWIDTEFKKTIPEFRRKYKTPKVWIGIDFMEDDF